MEKLELKHLYAYSHDGLKVMWGSDIANIIGIIRNAVVLNGDFWNESQKTDINNIKPILFPLSSLTKAPKPPEVIKFVLVL
mgnify:CR=1 FL=1